MDIGDTERQYRYEQKEHKVRKVFWVIIALILGAALLGVFGRGGPMSQVRIDEENFYVEYERFMRDESPSAISVFIKRSRTDSLQLAIGKTYLEHIKVQEIIPQPLQVISRPEQVVFTFGISEGGLIVINITPQEWGVLDLQFTLAGKTYHLKQYIYF